MPRQNDATSPLSEPAAAIWIVVADAGRARILSALRHDGQLKELFDLVNPDARLQDHDTLSDRAGHVTQGPAGMGHSFEPRESHSEHIAETFAKDLCHRLNAARCSGELGRIYLLAAPKFLGLLRNNLDKETHKLVVQELATDLTRHPLIDIRNTLPAQL